MSAEGRPRVTPTTDVNPVPEPGTVRRTPDSRTVGEGNDDADRPLGGDTKVRAPEDVNATPPHGDATLDP